MAAVWTEERLRQELQERFGHAVFREGQAESS
jgi:hypothetical protein